MSLRTIFLSLQLLLATPDPSSPQDEIVAEQFLKDYPSFETTAKHWTQTFAKLRSFGGNEEDGKACGARVLEGKI